MQKVVSTSSKTTSSKAFTLNVWALSTEIGFKIAIPLIIAVLLGIKLDKQLGTIPLFTLMGMLLAASLSAYLIYRDIKRLQKQLEK